MGLACSDGGRLTLQVYMKEEYHQHSKNNYINKCPLIPMLCQPHKLLQGHPGSPSLDLALIKTYSKNLAIYCVLWRERLPCLLNSIVWCLEPRWAVIVTIAHVKEPEGWVPTQWLSQKPYWLSFGLYLQDKGKCTFFWGQARDCQGWETRQSAQHDCGAIRK